MITYVYDCELCGEFEWKQHITDDTLTACPVCGSPVRRIIKGAPTVWWVGGPHLKDAGLL